MLSPKEAERELSKRNKICGCILLDNCNSNVYRINSI